MTASALAAVVLSDNLFPQVLQTAKPPPAERIRNNIIINKRQQITTHDYFYFTLIHQTLLLSVIVGLFLNK